MIKKRVLEILESEPEVSTVLATLAASQAICPGFCVSCTEPIAGAIGGGFAIRLLRWLRRK